MATQFIQKFEDAAHIPVDTPSAAGVGIVSNALVIRGTGTAGSFDHTKFNSPADDKTIRLNSRDYTQTSGDSIGFQSKPRATGTGTSSVYGAQISPRFGSAVGGNSLVGVEASPILQGTTGDLTGDYRAFDAILEDGGAGRTITGVATALRVRSNLGSTVTGGAHILHVLNEEGATAWTSFALFETGAAVAVAPGNTTALSNMGYILIQIGSTLYRIPVLENE